MAMLGLGRTFQNLALFSRMTVRENILVGAHPHHHAGFLRDCFRLPGARSREEQAQASADAMIELLGLRKVQHRLVADLPFGTQKRVEMARALASQPRMIMLDEPACGLNHEELQELQETIWQAQRRFDLTLMLVEHHMALVMALTDHIVVLNFGCKIAEGSPDFIRRHPEVLKAYLGGEEEDAA